MRRRTIAVTGALAMIAATARAQLQPGPTLTGSLRLGYWSSTRDLDQRSPWGAGMLWLKGSTPVPDGMTVVAEGWAALRGPPRSSHGTVELREAFLTFAPRTFDLRIGRQILAWGRADGVNPTGNLAAEDLTLLTPDDADQRLGTMTAVASYVIGGTSVTGVWMPEFRGDRFPLPSDAGSFVHDVQKWPGDQWAVRVERTGGSVDWSASVFQGLDLTPDVAPSDAPGRVTLVHHRIRAFGADASTTFGRFGVRAEAAYVQTTDRRGVDPFSKNPFLFAVVGTDRTFADGRFNVNVQYLARLISRFQPAPVEESSEQTALAAEEAVLSSQVKRMQHGASMRASYKWLHETLETEWAAIAYVAPGGIAIRPKVTYAVSDRISTIAGAELFRGREGALFQLLRPNSVTYLEVRWGF